MKTKLRNFFLIFLCNCKIKFYFCITKTSLSYGVMVTQQILVLLFLVRIQVAQLKKRGSLLAFFILPPRSSPPEQPVSQCETNKPRFRRISALSPTSEILISKSEPYSKPGIKNRQSICTHTRFPSCFTRSLTLLLYCTGDMKNSSGIVQGAGYTRKSDASGKSVRI